MSSVALRLDNEVWLFDCGEATQHQLMRSKLKYAKITNFHHAATGITFSVYRD